MESNVRGETVLNRGMPLMLLGFGALHLVDWAYMRFSDPWKLINGVGVLLMGGALFAANRARAAGAPVARRSSRLALPVSRSR